MARDNNIFRGGGGWAESMQPYAEEDRDTWDR